MLLILPVPAYSASIVVRWNANTEDDLAGYKVYSGTQSGVYGTPADVGNSTSCQFNNVKPGTKYYFAITAYDTSGNESAKSTEASVFVPIPDTVPPTGAVTINSGSATTPSRAVTLTLSAADSGGTVTAMKFSNDGVNWSDEVPYATSQAWVLSENDGVKTVYVNYKDAAGNWMSTPASDTITFMLDTDGDGLPDSWESTNGLDKSNPSDAALDSDGDGVSNLEEYYNHTNPFNASDNIPVVKVGSSPSRETAPTLVYLDGSASYDPNGITLQYTWVQISGPMSVTLENASTARASFVGTKAGRYRFKLTCFNGRVSVSDTVDITILNVAPTVSAGNDVAINVNTQVVLHAAGSDPNQDKLSYQWSLTAGQGVALPNMARQDIALIFTAAGQYKFSVICSDGALTSPADEVIVTVNAVNHAPTADAGPDQTVQAGTLVTLDGRGSTDPDANTLTYSWRQIAGTQVSLQNARSSTPYFTASAVGTFEFELIVNDGYISSVADTVWVTVLKQNTAPVADAGDDLAAYAGSRVALDGTGSYDPDGDAITYTWTQTSGARVVLTGAKTARPSFTPTTSGVLGFTLRVSDGQAATQDTVLVTVDNVNQVPIAEAGQDKTATIGSTVTLDGSQSKDPDGDAISYVWSQVSGPIVSLNSPNSARPSFVPTIAGAYVFSLKVYDGKDTSSADTVTVTVQQTAVAISLFNPQYGASVSENPLFTWGGTGLSKFKVFISVDKRRYSAIYSGSGKSCRMNTILWNWFIPSGTTIYWYVEGTTKNGQKVNSSLSYLRKR
ncbi:MAG TPA: PKD domain-containing protein [Deltaproteobacteria bacterium]|nr:PKD domain-containing protein [Deltaproteobacteria bacterium]